MRPGACILPGRGFAQVLAPMRPPILGYQTVHRPRCTAAPSPEQRGHCAWLVCGATQTTYSNTQRGWCRWLISKAKAKRAVTASDGCSTKR